MTNLLKTKLGFVSVTTFSLSIVVILALLVFSYSFFNNSKLNSQESISKTEVLNSIISFRGQILSIQNLKNTSLIYKSKLDSSSIEIRLSTNVITGIKILDSKIIEISIPSLVIFCNNYTFYPSITTTFKNNETCISKLD